MLPPERARRRGRRRRPIPAPSEEEVDVVPAAWSDVELLKHKDFAELHRRRARRRPAAARPARPRQARCAARGARGALAAARRRIADHRATMRASLRYGGEPLDRRCREPTARPRPLVLVVDVSGSMEPYARMLLGYAQACVAGRRRVEAFAFGTRLTRLTRELAGRDPDAALARAAAAVVPTGTAARASGRRSPSSTASTAARSGAAPRSSCSPTAGTAGEPDELAAEMARLRRCAHEVDLAQPAQGPARATSRSPAGWSRRCRTSTRSSPATRSARSRSSPRVADRTETG